MPRRLIDWSSKLIPFRGRWWGTAPVNVRSVSENHNALRQADSGFGDRCYRKSSKAPFRPDSLLPVRPLNLMTFATGGTPRARSQQYVPKGPGRKTLFLRVGIRLSNVSVFGIWFLKLGYCNGEFLLCFLKLRIIFLFMHWRRKWQPTPVFLPGESQGRGSLVGCRLWGRTESDTTEAT